jgi:hypothetical protein
LSQGAAIADDAAVGVQILQKRDDAAKGGSEKIKGESEAKNRLLHTRLLSFALRFITRACL